MPILDAISPAPSCLRLPSSAPDVKRGENREAGCLAANPVGHTPALARDFGSAVVQSFVRNLPKKAPWFECVAVRPGATASRKLPGLS